MSLAALDDHALAAALATEAGRLLVRLRQEMLRHGAQPWDVRDTGDALSQQFLAERLATARPGDAVLSEEAEDDPVRLGSERVWIVDPLDGTWEYGEPGRRDWAVHVALAVGGDPTVGAVALAAEDLTFATRPAPPPPKPLPDRPRVVTSRSRPSVAALIIADALGADVVPLGSAGAKAMAVVRGLVHVYAHAGLNEWDSAAPVAVARAAGLHVSHFDGTPLRYNRPDPWHDDVLVCHPDLASAVLEALSGNEDLNHRRVRPTWLG